MNNYLVTLTPTGRFFFGGDMTFSVGDMEKDKNSENEDAKKRTSYNEKFASYLIRSSKFPQQTSLLGMLRFFILSRDASAFDSERQKIVDTKEAEKLIGKHGFTVNANHKENSFGKIASIGTCFLRKGKDSYWTAPLDYGLTVGNFESGVVANLNKKSLDIPIITKGENEYTSKDSLGVRYISSSGEALEEKAIFKEDIRIGIRKNGSGKTEEDAFYKQIGYRLEKGVQFAFMVKTEEDLAKYGKQLVSVGADSSVFVFEAFRDGKEPEWPDSYERSRPDADWQKVVLLADSYLESSDLEDVKYAMTAMKPFRFIKSTVEDKSYNLVHNLHNRSERYNLYSAGSIFFVEEKNVEKLKKCIGGKTEFVQIGYNNCK